MYRVGMPTNATLTLSGELLAEARGWLLDCFGDESATIATASADRITAAVQRHYDGGLAAFIRDAS